MLLNKIPIYVLLTLILVLNSCSNDSFLIKYNAFKSKQPLHLSFDQVESSDSQTFIIKGLKSLEEEKQVIKDFKDLVFPYMKDHKKVMVTVIRSFYISPDREILDCEVPILGPTYHLRP